MLGDKLTCVAERGELLTQGLRPWLRNILDHAYIVGGALRADTYRDVDIVVEGIDLESAIRTLADCDEATVRKNHFGGFHCNLAGTRIDIWELGKSWCFTQEPDLPVTLDSLMSRFHTNIQAIAYDTLTHRVHDRGYFECLETNTLELIWEPNPFPFYAFSKAERIAKEMGLEYGPKLKKAMIDAYQAKITGIVTRPDLGGP